VKPLAALGNIARELWIGGREFGKLFFVLFVIVEEKADIGSEDLLAISSCTGL
jgi:hypothetical protein